MKPHVILIDFENVQPKDLACLRGRPFTTKVFCGANQTKIPLDLVEALQPLGPDAEYIRIHGTGHNALDFHIAYYIGRLSAESPGATFYIISKDTGFDPLIAHLKSQSLACCRLSSLADIPKPAPAHSPSAQDPVQKVANALITLRTARPGTLKTLTAFIKAQLNTQASDEAISQVIARLTQAGLSTHPQGKLTWPSL